MEFDPAAPSPRTPRYHPPSERHRHQLINLNSFALLIIIPAMLIAVLVIVFSVLLIFRRVKPGKNSHSNSIVRGNNDIAEKQKSCKITSYANKADRVHRSPDVRSCIYGGNLGFSLQAKYRGGQVFTYRELEVATEGFSKGSVIGCGTFGKVYRGKLSDGTVAAIKVLSRGGKQGEREFRIEVDLMSRLHSPYVIELLGYCADQQHRLLVFEFMTNDSLHFHLHPPHQNHQSQPLDWQIRLRIAADCARGLEFLHEYTNPTVIHRDFNCSNILLDQNYRAKVSNFGLAKLGSEKINGQVLTRVLGTTGYVSPEYASTGKLTTKSDVYSFGVVLLELLTGKVPVDLKRPPGQHVLVSWALPRLTNREKVMEMVDPALQGQCSKKELIQVAAIAAMCVQTEADYRPLMTDVVQSLIPLVRNPDVSIPTTPSRFQHQIVIPPSHKII